MNKRQLIDEITAMNRTAQPGFLARFDEADLDEYLKHLQHARQSRITGDASRYQKYFRSEPHSSQRKPQVVAPPVPQADPAPTAVAVMDESPAGQFEPVVPIHESACEMTLRPVASPDDDTAMQLQDETETALATQDDSRKWLF